MNKQSYMSLLWSIVCLISIQSIVFAEEVVPTNNPTELNAPLKPASESKVFKIGVLANNGIDEAVKRWTPTAEYLTKQIPPYVFEIVPLTFNEVHFAVRRNAVDLILVNPQFYADLEYMYGLSPIATLNSKLSQGKSHSMIGGVIFTRSNRNDIRTYQDLKAKSFMAMEKLSFAGWLVALCELKQHKIDPEHYFANITFGGSHDAVVYAVRDGVVDAGTVRTGTLERMAAEGKIKIEDFFVLNARQDADFPLLLSTDLYPEWSFAKMPKFSNQVATQIAIALLQITPDNPAAVASHSVGWLVAHNYRKVSECLSELRTEHTDGMNLTTTATYHILLNYWNWIIIILLLLILGIMVIKRD